MKTLKTAIIGCGLIAQAKHLPALQALRRHVRLEAVCDTNQSLAESAAKKSGTARAYTALADLLGEVRPKLVLLCTPPQTHRALAVECLQAGAHLFVEKPMALTTADCQSIVDAARQGDRKVCVAFSQSFTPIICKARDWISAGRIGPLEGMSLFLSTPFDYMTAKESHWVHRLPGGFLSETGPHVIHMAMSFLGPVRKTWLFARKQQPVSWTLADDLRIHLECERGTCSVILRYTADYWAARVDLMGKKALLTADLESGLLLRHERKNLQASVVFRSEMAKGIQAAGQMARSGIEYLLKARKSGHDTLLERFILSLQRGTHPPVDPQEGLEVTRVLEELTAQLKASA